MMEKIDHKNWIKGDNYQKRILLRDIKENINLIEDVILYPKESIPCHIHEFTGEIFYITHNNAIMIVDGEEFEVKEGDMIKIEKNENHGFRNESNTEFKMIVFKIDHQKGDSFLKDE